MNILVCLCLAEKTKHLAFDRFFGFSKNLGLGFISVSALNGYQIRKKIQTCSVGGNICGDTFGENKISFNLIKFVLILKFKKLMFKAFDLKAFETSFIRSINSKKNCFKVFQIEKNLNKSFLKLSKLLYD